MPLLHTERLTLVPVSFKIVDAALHDREGLSRLLDARIPDDWPASDFAGFLQTLG